MLSEKAVVTNIYQGFILTAVKFCANVKALSVGSKSKKYSKLYLSACLIIIPIHPIAPI